MSGGGGWGCPHTVIQIVNDDMPFLVDSVTAALNSRGYGVRLLIHPVIGVKRDAKGKIVEPPVAFVGGVAANGRLREKVTVDARKKGISVYLPDHDLCGDNAAMIAAAGHHYLQKGRRGKLDDDVYSRVPL